MHAARCCLHKATAYVQMLQLDMDAKIAELPQSILITKYKIDFCQVLTSAEKKDMHTWLPPFRFQRRLKTAMFGSTCAPYTL